MTDKDKLEKIKKLADAMYYAAQQLTTDASRLHKAMEEYHKFIIHECKEEPASEDLENASLIHLKDVMEFEVKTGLKMANTTSFKTGARWQKEQMEKKAFPVEIGQHRSDYKCMLHGNFLHYNTGDKVKVIIIKQK